jgi:hypothetical protein
MKLTWKIGAVVLVATCLTSCAQILGDLLFPNYCQECKVLDMSNSVVWSEEECGGGQDDMETRCKAEAYDRGYGATCECNLK